MSNQPPVIDYEGSTYSTEFWTGAREYEDRAERIAIQAMLPPRGGRLIDIGAGAGRLGDLYLGYDEVILMDYARSTIVEARDRWGHDPRFKFVAADLYTLPFVDAAFDSIVMIRVIHHIVDVPRALHNIRAAMKPTGRFVFEFANKRNLKAIARYTLRKQGWSPFNQKPIEFVELNFDFHPDWMKQQLTPSGLCNPTGALRFPVSRECPQALIRSQAPRFYRWCIAAPLRAVSRFAEHVCPLFPRR